MENIGNCTKAKSVLNVLGPIANQVVELKGRHGIVCDATTVMQLLKQCHSLKTACDLLVSRLASHAQSHKDSTLSNDVQLLKKKLEESIDSFTDFTRDLHRGDVGVRENEEVWSDIVENAESLLSVLTEALLAWDRAQVRKISSAVKNVQDRLRCLQKVHFVQHLPDDFQEVVTSCGELLMLVQQRCKDLYRRAQSEMLQLIALQLCHTLPLLASTCTATVSHPLSKQVKASRELVLTRFQTLLKDLELHSDKGHEEYDGEEAGTFISFVDKTLDLLIRIENPNNVNLSTRPVSEQVKSLLEEVLRHGVAVAYCSSPDDKSVIMNMCENVLKHLKNLVSIERVENRDIVDYDVAKEILADNVESLEQKINTALIRQIVKTFAIPLAPLEALLKTFETSHKNISTKEMEDLVADFDLHVDLLFQVGGFAAACTSDMSRVRIIRDSLLTLEWLESCLIPSVISARNDPTSHALAHARMLAKHWSMAVVQLRSSLDEIMDPSAFSLVTKQEVHQLWASLKEQLYTMDTSWISKQVGTVIALSSRVLALHQLDSFLTTHQENDLTAAIFEMKASLASVVSSPEDQSFRRSLIKRVQLSLTLLSRLANSLNEENLHFMEEFTIATPVITNQAPKLLSEKQHLLTSNIDDIPIDVATPFAAVPVSRTSKNTSSQEDKKADRPQTLLRSTRSASKLGEGRVKATHSNLTMQGNHSRSMQAIASDTLGLETSIDITKFLSRSTNTLTSSVRSSKRNFSLKVKEINLDIDAALKKVDLPPLPSHPDTKRVPPDHLKEKYATMESPNESKCYDDKYSEISDLISKEASLQPSQVSIGDELTGILEDLTSLAGELTALATPSVQKRKCQWENFGNTKINTQVKENQSTSILHGIKVQNLSFNPQFPEIKDKNTSEVVFEDEPRGFVDGAEAQNIANVSTLESSGHVQSEGQVWKDFTAILETKTPAKANMYNFSSNFDNWQPSGTPMSFTTFGKNTDTSVNKHQSITKVVDLSDTPFLVKSASQASLYTSGSISDRLASNYSVSPSSATFGTPQRLKDIQLVQQRLKILKENMK